MKFGNVGRAVWAGAVSMGLLLGIAACGKDNTIDYLFVANAKNNPGQINVYLVDGESGSLTQILDSPYPSGATNQGRFPVSLVTSPNQKYLYVLNHDDNTIVYFGIGTDAKLYPEHTYNTPGNSPTSMKMSADGTLLYVVDAFQAQYNATNPGPGAVVVYPISAADGSLGTPTSYAACNNPVDLALPSGGGFVYVVNDPAGQPPKLAQDIASTSVGANGTSTITYTATGACVADSGQVNVYSIASGGVLTQIAGSPFAAGAQPVAIASDASGSHVYIADTINNVLLGYTASSGVLTPSATPSYLTGNSPDAVTLDATGQYLFVANYSGSLSSFSVGAGGILSTLEQDTDVNAGASYVFIEPNGGKFLYVSGFLDSTVFGTELNTANGALSTVQYSPFTAAGQPTAIAAITHGAPPK